MSILIWLFIILLGFFLFIFYLILKFLDKKKLNKAKEEYNAEEDKSRGRETIITRDSFARGDKFDNVPKPEFERNDKSERRNIFSPKSLVNFGKDSSKSGTELRDSERDTGRDKGNGIGRRKWKFRIKKK